MFTELMPLLAERTVLITVARESDTTIRANVVPKQVNEGENVALSTPLSFVGTPEELDRDFARDVTTPAAPGEEVLWLCSLSVLEPGLDLSRLCGGGLLKAFEEGNTLGYGNVGIAVRENREF